MSTALLQIRLGLQAFGWYHLAVGLLLLLAIALHFTTLSHLRGQTQATATQLANVERQLKQPLATIAPEPVPVAEKNVNQFYDTLGENRYAQEQINTLFAIAKKQELTLTQGEYKDSLEPNGRYRKYQITLPIKGTYSAIRRFCENMLVAIPFASLDELSFKRDNISSRTVEAKLRLTLYLSDKTLMQESQP